MSFVSLCLLLIGVLLAVGQEAVSSNLGQKRIQDWKLHSRSFAVVTKRDQPLTSEVSLADSRERSGSRQLKTIPEQPGSPWGKLIVSLRTVLQFNCAVLLTGGDADLRDKRMALELQKDLHAAGIPMGTTKQTFFTTYRWIVYCSTRPLYVVDGTKPAAVRWLVKLSHYRSWGLGSLRLPAGRTERLALNPAWLLFLDDSQEPSVALGDADVSIDSLLLVARRRGDVIRIVEVFQVAAGTELQQVEVGEWSAAGGLAWTRRTLQDRRRNLLGTPLRVAAHHFPPFAPLEISRHTKTGLRVGGFIGKVWDIVAEQLNCSTDLYKLPTPYVGSLTPYLQYGGGITLGLIDYSPTTYMVAQVDSSSTLFSTRFNLYIRHPGHVGLGWSGFAAPFSPKLWLSVATVIGVLVVALAATYTCLRPVTMRMEVEEPAAAFYVVGMFLQQGHTSSTRSLALQLVYLAGYVAALVVLASYNAKLVSFLTVQKQSPLPFFDPQGLLQYRPAYNFGVAFESTTSLVLSGLSDPSLRELYDRSNNDAGRWQTTLPLNISEGFRRVCAHRYVLFEQEDRVLALSGQIPCDVTTLPGFSLALPVVLPFAKGGGYRGLANRVLSRLRESGLLSKLLADGRPKTMPPPDDSLSSIRVMSVFPVLVALEAGLAVAVLLLAAECLYWRLRRNRQLLLPAA